MLRAKTCSRCNAVKEIQKFNKQKDGFGGYSPHCKVCSTNLSKKYYADNSERVKGVVKEYSKNNKETIAAKSKEYRTKNEEALKERSKKYYQENKEHIIAKVRAYYPAYIKANKDIKNASTARRRSKKLHATVSWGDSISIRAFYKEAARLTQETGIPHHVDHIVPLQGKNVSGLHWEGNMQILTASENSSKGNRYVSV